MDGNADIYEYLWGNADKKTKGVVEKSKGDLEVLMGRVVSWDAKATRQGGWDCSLEIVSQNDALLDHAISEENLLKQRFVTGLPAMVINESARLVGGNFLRGDWMSSPESLEESLVILRM